MKHNHWSESMKGLFLFCINHHSGSTKDGSSNLLLKYKRKLQQIRNGINFKINEAYILKNQRVGSSFFSQIKAFDALMSSHQFNDLIKRNIIGVSFHFISTSRVFHNNNPYCLHGFLCLLFYFYAFHKSIAMSTNFSKKI